MLRRLMLMPPWPFSLFTLTLLIDYAFHAYTTLFRFLRCHAAIIAYAMMSPDAFFDDTPPPL